MDNKISCMYKLRLTIPIPPMGFPWECKPNCLNKWDWDGNGNSSDGNENAYY